MNTMNAVLSKIIVERYPNISPEQRRLFVIGATAAALYISRFHFLVETHQRSPNPGESELANNARKSPPSWNFGLQAVILPVRDSM